MLAVRIAASPLTFFTCPSDSNCFIVLSVRVSPTANSGAGPKHYGMPQMEALGRISMNDNIHTAPIAEPIARAKTDVAPDRGYSQDEGCRANENGLACLADSQWPNRHRPDPARRVCVLGTSYRLDHAEILGAFRQRRQRTGRLVSPSTRVPESVCVECNESLMPRIEAKWCKIHEVHFCPFERPESPNCNIHRKSLRPTWTGLNGPST